MGSRQPAQPGFLRTRSGAKVPRKHVFGVLTIIITVCGVTRRVRATVTVLSHYCSLHHSLEADRHRRREELRARDLALRSEKAATPASQTSDARCSTRAIYASAEQHKAQRSPEGGGRRCAVCPCPRPKCNNEQVPAMPALLMVFARAGRCLALGQRGCAVRPAALSRDTSAHGLSSGAVAHTLRRAARGA